LTTLQINVLERGRYHNIDLENRVCKFCILGSIENECTEMLENSI